MGRDVYTTVVMDMETMEVVYAERYAYDGPWAECKHGAEKQISQDQLNLQNQLTQQNLAFQHQLAGMVTPYINNLLQSGQGFDPAQLALMRAQSIQNTAGQFNNALGSVKTALAQRGLAGGGALPVSGLYGQGFGALAGQGALAQSQNLGNIDIANAQQRLQNIWNSANALGGLAGLFSPAPFVSGASNALGNRVQAGLAPNFFQSFGTGLGSALGQGIGGWATGAGGLGKLGG